jgi:PadR family transcriptional regulator, regulatory protein PadR
MDANLLKGTLDLILLNALERGEKYGGQIISEVQFQTDGYFSFKEGTLYPALHRLEKQKWVTAEFRQLPRGGSAVRFYTLTEAGGKALEAKRTELARFNSVLRKLVGGSL